VVRADRLVALLLLMQQRRQLTVAQVAAELETSERTARRDLEALGLAGLPVYSVSGRNGGWRLLGEGRTDLTGLTSTEAQAIFLAAGSLAHASPELKAALRKLMRALPEPFRPSAEAASKAVVVDPQPWEGRGSPAPPPPLLDAIRSAVIEGRQLRLVYSGRSSALSERVVEPLGLAAKGSTWYLVAGTAEGQRTFRVDRIRAAEPTGNPAARPHDFDFRLAWGQITERVDEMRTPILASAVVSPTMVNAVSHVLGDRVRIGLANDDGRVRVELRGQNIRALAGELGGFGAAVEVLEPLELRYELARIGRQLIELYENEGHGP
jgi:predicted DNA-binding transcriptional regulator YafY